MRILLLIILLIPSICFANLDAIHSIDSVPAYDGCDGVVIDCYSITPCQINCYSDVVNLYSSVFGIIPCQINVYSSVVDFYWVSDGLDAINVIDPVPVYDSCDGVVIDCFGITPCQVNVYSDPVNFYSLLTYFTITPCQINCYATIYGAQRKWKQGRTWEQGRSWSGNPKAIKWQGNKNVIMMGQ